MSNHAWVAVQYMPVQVEPDGENLQVTIAEDAEQMAKDDEVLCCWFCDIPLTTETYNTTCAAQEK